MLSASSHRNHLDIVWVCFMSRTFILQYSCRTFILPAYVSILFHPDLQHYVLLLKVCFLSAFLQKITAFLYILFWEGVFVWVGWSVWFLCGGGRLCGGILVVWLWCILKESCCLFPLCLAALPEFSPLPPPPESTLLTQHTLTVTTLSRIQKTMHMKHTHSFPLRLWLHLLPQMDMMYAVQCKHLTLPLVLF